ncbi:MULTISPECIES: riboflavin synthase [Rhodomicrobium]|uniref:riboflavin synthase n=1 Tax=Rhodomicrobium TaxID=1068 RepID=UPI000B4BE3A4|nr:MULTISPECIES: riboflavin synthase [Rhodomicrobium]
MFTGIITDIGELIAADGGLLRIACHSPAETIAIGASIACDGCCLTVTRVEATAPGASIFDVEASNETFARTTLGNWSVGHRVNLERSLKLGDELGGHMVAGHVDGVARIVAATPDGTSTRFEIACPPGLARFVAEKGSVALDGTSLTVNSVSGNNFTVNIIPHTLEVTSWGQKRAGDALNMEVDLMARYVARLSEHKEAGA